METCWKYEEHNKDKILLEDKSKTYLLLRNLEKRRWTGRKVPNRRTLVLHTVKGRS